MPGQQNILRLWRMLQPYTASIPKTRVGALTDGGYVVNDDLAGLDGVVSIGIGNEVSFDMELAQLGAPVFQYDPTVDRPPLAHPRFTFRKLAWARHDSETTRSLATMLSENQTAPNSRDLLLKFDVEDAEWGALDGLDPGMLDRFRIIVGEFHWLQRLRDDAFFEIAWRTFSLLTRHHVVTHLHANNTTGAEMVEGLFIPRLLEISFLRRDRATFTRSHDSIPSALDRPNNPALPDIVLSPFGVW